MKGRMWKEPHRLLFAGSAHASVGILDFMDQVKKEKKLGERGEIGFGVVGLGMGQHHALAITNAKGARWVAVCDVDGQRVEQVVTQYGSRGMLPMRSSWRTKT
ncbi:MAG: hypothetical protein V1800_15535 [Candidatus Latescibacterota bacterium]